MVLYDKLLERVHHRSSRMFNSVLREFTYRHLLWEASMFADFDKQTSMINWNLMKFPVVNKFRLGVLAILTRHHGWEVNIFGGSTKEWEREIKLLFG